VTRPQERKGFDHETRVALLETDMDDIYGDVASIRQSIQRLTWAMAAAALSFGTSALLLALNLSVINS